MVESDFSVVTQCFSAIWAGSIALHGILGELRAIKL